MIAIVFRKKEKLFCKIVVPFVFVDEIVDDIAAGHDADEAPPVVLDGDEGVLFHPAEQVGDRGVLFDRGIEVAPDDILQATVLERVQIPQSKQIIQLALEIQSVYGSPVMLSYLHTSTKKLPLNKSPTALPANDNPMIATVGPITTAGMILSIHFVPANLTTNERIT